MRPLLLPHLRRFWRDGRTVQLGTDPRLATVLELGDPATARVLDLLDGSRTEHRVLADAAGFGVPAADAQALCDAVRGAGLVVGAGTLLPGGLPETVAARLTREAGALALSRLAAPEARLRRFAAAETRVPPQRPPDGAPDPAERTPADMLRRRGTAQVLIAGNAWLGAVIASILAHAGVGSVDPALDGWAVAADAAVGGLLAADNHRSRATAAADAVRRAAPETRITPLRAGAATFVVRVGTRPGSALATRGVRERKAPHLEVYLRDGTVVVGPLILPDEPPCGYCLFLHRQDRDPAWPALAAQLATARPATEPCAVTTALAGAAYAAEEVLRHIDGRPGETFGAAVEITAPGVARRRSWSPHPACDCSRRKRSRTTRRPAGRPSKNGS
jgi:bacteriocin biosynthesis cyclodehydratase domain-containing protein